MKHASLLVAIAVILLPFSVCAREWTDKTGAFHVEAELVFLKDGKVYLEKNDGKVIGVPLSALCKTDILYLTSLSKYKDYFAANPIPDQPLESGSAPSSGFTPPAVITLQVSDPSKVGEVRRFGDLGWAVNSLAFSPNGQFLAVGKMDRALIVYDLNKSARVAFIEDLDGLGQVTSLAFAPDGKKLLSGGYSGRIQVWSVDADGGLEEANRFVGHSRAVHSITVSKDGQYVLSGGDEKIARCWTLADAREQFAIDGFANSVKATFITPAAKQALACDGKTIALIDIRQAKAIQTMELGYGGRQAVAIATDGSRVVTNNAYTLQSWDIKSGKGYPVLQDQEIQWFATFHTRSKYLLSGGRGKVNLWDVENHRKVYEFDTAGSGYVKSIAVSPDNRHFAAIPGSAGQELQVFRMPAVVEDQ